MLIKDFAKLQRLEGMSQFFKIVGDFTIFNFFVIKDLFTRPRYIRETIYEMDKVGTYSLPIAFVTGFFTGLVLTLQTAKSLEVFGIKNYIGEVLAASVIREIGPVIGSLMIAGRVASGIASEVGAMAVGEQIDSLRVMGVNVIKKLAIPRVIAGVVMLPVLIVLVDFFAVIGGNLISSLVLRMPSSFYWSSVLKGVYLEDLIIGLVKPLVFGFIIPSFSTFISMRTKGGTEGVGRATTNAVVISSFLIILSDFILTKIYFLLFW